MRFFQYKLACFQLAFHSESANQTVFFPDSIPSLIETDCSVCTPKQKEKYDQVKKILTEKYPEMHKALLDKYSPKSE